MPLQTFAYQIINVFPKELHDQNKQGYKEGKHQWPDVRAKYEEIQFLQGRMNLCKNMK